MGIILPVGEIVATPPANTKELFLDADGDPKLLLHDGTTEDIGGGGGAIVTDATMSGDGTIATPLSASPLFLLDWRGDVLRRIQALAPSAGFNDLCWSSNCENLSADLVRATPTNTGDAVLDNTVNGGAILTSTGTTNNSACVVNPRDAIVTSPAARYVSNSRTQKSAVYVRAQIVAAPDASGKMCVICSLEDETNDNFLGGRGATSTTKWVFSVGGVAADTGVAFDLLVHDLVVINDGTDVKAYLDWVQIGVSAAASGIATTPGFPRWYDANGATGADVSHRTYRAAMAVVKAAPAGVTP